MQIYDYSYILHHIIVKIACVWYYFYKWSKHSVLTALWFSSKFWRKKNYTFLVFIRLCNDSLSSSKVHLYSHTFIYGCISVLFYIESYIKQDFKIIKMAILGNILDTFNTLFMRIQKWLCNNCLNYNNVVKLSKV